MTDSNKSISPLRQRMIDDMTLRKLAPKTQAGYLRAVMKFTHFFGRSPDLASPEDLRRFQLQQVEAGVSSTTIHTCTASYPAVACRWTARAGSPASQASSCRCGCSRDCSGGCCWSNSAPLTTPAICSSSASISTSLTLRTSPTTSALYARSTGWSMPSVHSPVPKPCSLTCRATPIGSRLPTVA